jgi:hypothetical protein
MSFKHYRLNWATTPLASISVTNNVTLQSILGTSSPGQLEVADRRLMLTLHKETASSLPLSPSTSSNCEGETRVTKQADQSLKLSAEKKLRVGRLQAREMAGQG